MQGPNEELQEVSPEDGHVVAMCRGNADESGTWSSCLVGLECGACHALHEASLVQQLCRTCGLPLLARYDLERARNTLTRDAMRTRSTLKMWRYFEMLPILQQRFAISLVTLPSLQHHQTLLLLSDKRRLDVGGRRYTADAMRKVGSFYRLFADVY